MSYLDTIDIQGIRSIGVGPQNAIVIEFLSPLTIICGPNGSGKTTIIESLKYATTSELPSGRMPSFIHDYRLAGKSRIDASVKLKFKDIRNRSCVVTRRMTARAEGAKGKLTTKSEESTIAIEKEPDEWTSLSSKVIDCKKEVLNLMGVPAAILEYVVFCHQEESNWPLDEPKKLKERFDEIFQVSGYVKSIEVLKKEIKENQQQMQVSQGRLPLLIEQQHRKIELHNEYIESKRHYELEQKEAENNKTVLNDLKRRWDDAKTVLAEAANVERDAERFRTEYRVLHEQYTNCTTLDYQGSIDDLKALIEQMSKSAEFLSVERERRRIEETMQELNSKMQLLMNKKDAFDRNISLLKADQMLREKLEEEKREILSRSSQVFKLDVHGDIKKQLAEAQGRISSELTQFQKEAEPKIASCQRDFDAASWELARIRSEISAKDEDCMKLDALIRGLTAELGHAAGSQQEIESLEMEMRTLTEELNKANADTDAIGNIGNLKVLRDEIASKMSRLQSECRSREGEEESECELRRVTEDESRLEQELVQLSSRHSTALNQLFKGEQIIYPLGDHLTSFVRKLERTAAMSEEERDERIKKQIAAQNRVDQISRDIDQTTHKIAEHKRNVSKVVSCGEDAEAKLSEVNEVLTKTRQELGVLHGCIYLYDQWQQQVEQKTCCPLCERKYTTAQDASQLSAKMNRKRAELPDEMERLQRKVREYEETQSELIEVVPYVKIIRRLTTDSEELQSDLQLAQKKLRSAEEEVKRATEDRERTFTKREAFRSVQADASLVDKTWDSLSAKRREVKRLKAELDVGDSEQRTPVAVLRTQLSQCQKDHERALSTIDGAQVAISDRNRIVEMLNGIREQRMALLEKRRDGDRLSQSLGDKTNELESIKAQLVGLTNKLPNVEIRFKETLDERTSTQSYLNREEIRFMDMKREVENVITQIEAINTRMEGSENGAKELKVTQNCLSSVNAELTDVDQTMRALSCKFDNVNSKQERKRRLEDQLRKMELADRVEELKRVVDSTRWRGKPLDELRREEEMLQRSHRATLLDLERNSGKLEHQKKSLDEKKEKLDSRDFIRSEDDFKKEVITKCVTEKVIEDLSRYIRAVDESIVEFHAKKMEEINEILASLWEKVYRGADIESIQIKSESVDATEKRKSYNYRVVMYMEGKEIDMPGRCSAGQKMLASILIRIALSDVFCDKCSIIALDEPTTNLDVLKVENLGDMLAEILEERSGKMFQLIVITHDYRFVEHLRQLCRPEWLYALTKDSDGMSRIKRHRNIMETVVRED